MRNHFLRAAAAGAAEVDRSWDIAYAEFTGTPKNWFYVGNQDSIPTGVFFKSDGTKLYMLGNGNDSIYEYNLSTAWDVSTASYVQSFSVNAQESVPTGVFFKNDGTKMYILGNAGDDVNEYSLSSAWDISTASYIQNFSVATQDTNPTSLFFKSDGSNLYVLGNITDRIYEYSLSTAWDISTASYVRNFSVAGQESVPTGVFFKGDGTKMYITGQTGDDVNEYSLSTAWNVSTASYVQNFSVRAQEATPQALFFKGDGTQMYIVGSSSDTIWQYSLSTAWDISTTSFSFPTTDYFSVAAQESNPSDVFFKSDGARMYIIGNTGDDVNEYSLSSAWEISTASYVQSFSVSAQESVPQGLFFKPDGTKMYITGASGDDVNEYDLSTAWDVSSASYLQNFSVSAQETEPRTLFFKPDGTKMYVVGSSPAGRTVFEYGLSTAWDISSASYSQGFSVSSQELNPYGLFFKPDGTKMYIYGQSGDDINEYNLSTAWDVSTASYVQTSGITVPLEALPQGLFFKSDGTKFFTVGSQKDAVWAFTIS